MFTLKQIDEIHERLGSRESLVQYLQALKAIGVDTYDSFISDGHSEYFSADGRILVSKPVHELFTVAERSDQSQFMHYLSLSSSHKINYLEMSKGFADSGIEKWTFDTNNMTLTYKDMAGNTILTEQIT
ncbi:MAG TPA: DUF1398 family protein [Candidatus Saccharimonadales bacterium]|nr:DUF1398 family protein [Candidatus Saccharimonadales bacterium]